MKLTLSATLVASALADQVFFCNNEDVDRTGKITLWNFDTSTKSATEVTSWADNKFTYGGAVCANSYYGYWADIASSAFGLVAVDLATKATTYLDTDVLYHNLGCDPSDPSNLLAVGSVPGQTNAQFSFRRFDVSNNKDVHVADLPIVGFLGYDAAFSFTQDGKQLYGSGGTTSGIQKGYQYILDTATAKITYGPVQYPLGNMPYTVFPDNNPVTGWMSTQFGRLFSTLDFGSKITVKHGPNQDEYWNDAALAVCGEVAYTTDNVGAAPSWMLWGLSTGTGKVVVQANLTNVPHDSDYFIAGLACVRS